MSFSWGKVMAAASLLIFTLSFQNCSRVQFNSRGSASVEQVAEVVPDLSTSSLPKSCTLDGVTVLNSNTILAYATRTVAAGSSCNSISRTCKDGILDGSDSFQFSSCLPEVGIPCSAKAVSFANGTCTASLQPTAEGKTQSFSCTGRGLVNNTYKCDYPTTFIGHQYSQGVVSLTATCSSGGVWTTKEQMSGSNVCLESDSLYDCYQWIYQGTNGQILTTSNSYQVYNSATSELLTYQENNNCCSKKVRLEDCQDVSNGNKSCKAFCVN